MATNFCPVLGVLFLTLSQTRKLDTSKMKKFADENLEFD